MEFGPSNPMSRGEHPEKWGFFEGRKILKTNGVFVAKFGRFLRFSTIFQR